MKNKNTGIFLLLILLIALTGCGTGYVSLSGKVTFSDDNSPLGIGMIYFDNETNRSRAILQTDGSYVVGTMKNNDGLPPGMYNVSISGAWSLTPNELYLPETTKTQRKRELMEDDLGDSLIDTKYENATTSGLVVTVDGKSKIYDIVVDRAKKR